MKNIIEALLIATDVPLPLDKICEIVNQPPEDVRQMVEELNRDYRETNRAFEIKEIAGGYQIYTLPQFAEWIVILHKKKERLSKAALETLAVIAYHQPVTRADIEKARGVDSSWILESLMMKGLIKTCGRLDAPGRPIKYGTTKEFLRYFALNDLTDLPQEEKFALDLGGEPVAEPGPAEGIAEAGPKTEPATVPETTGTPEIPDQAGPAADEEGMKQPGPDEQDEEPELSKDDDQQK